MKRMLVGGLALGLGAGLALAGPAGATDEGPLVLNGSVEPNPVEAGAGMTIASDDACPVTEDAQVLVLWGTDGWFDTTDVLPEDFRLEAVNGDGTWSVAATAPAEPGEYDAVAVCASSEFFADIPPEALAGEDMTSDALASEAQTFTAGPSPQLPPFGFYEIDFTVTGGGDTPPPTDPEPTTPPTEPGPTTPPTTPGPTTPPPADDDDTPPADDDGDNTAPVATPVPGEPNYTG